MANKEFNAYEHGRQARSLFYKIQMNQTRERVSMGKETEQAKLLRAARDALDMTSEQLAEELGVSLPTLNSWLSPTSSKAHRGMPKTAKLLLDRILKSRKKK